MTDQIDGSTDTSPSPATVAAQVQSRRFTPDEVNAEVARALRDHRVEKPADYDDVKLAAERAAELEHTIKGLEGEMARVQLDSLRLSIAARFGVSADDAAVLMTGSDEASLTMQAERLAQSFRPLGNVSPREGGTAQTGTRGREQQEMREYVSELFGTDPY